MTADTTDGHLILAERLNTMAAASLHKALLARRGQDLALDAGSVTDMGALCLQLLLAAARDCRAAGRSFCITARSPAFDAALTTFAVPASALDGASR